MKTKVLFFVAIFIVFVSSLYASHTHLYLEDIDTDPSFYYCSMEYDSLIIHRPENGNTNREWETAGMSAIYDQDSVVMLSSDPCGHWLFYSIETDFVDFFIYFVSPAYEPANFEDENICTFSFSRILDAQNTEEGVSYLWSTDETTQTISVDAPGTYTVTITNVCGEGVFSKTITQGNPNAPDLGPDQEFCFGETTTLDPQSTNVTSTLWSTGSTDPQLVVGESGSYWVHVENTNGCNGRDTIEITARPTREIQICDVSYDTITNKNSINWFVDPLETEITQVSVKTKNDFGEWITFALEDYTTGSVIHWESNPQTSYNEYTIAAITDCGQGLLSDVHRSIWLTELDNELQWQNYYGTFLPDYYVVFARMSDLSLVEIGNVPACSGEGCLNHYNITPDSDVIKYFVAFSHDCDGTKNSDGWVFSNYFDTQVGITTSKQIGFNIYPNPATDNLIINIGTDTFEVRILTMLGQVILSEHNVKTLNVSNLSKGVYIISLTADGVTTNKRFVKN